MTFHLLREGQASRDSATAALEQEGLAHFAAHPTTQTLRRHYTDASGEPRLLVPTPGRMKEACITCDAASGKQALGNRKAGDLVPTFGVSVSTAELHRSQRNLRILSIVGGLALMVAIAAIFFYRVRVSLL